MTSMASRDAFGHFTFAAFSARNIPVVVVVMIIPSLIESSMFFFQSKLLILLYVFLKHMTSFWWLILFFIDLFFICSLRSVICKKYANANGKDSKYTNTVDISIYPAVGEDVEGVELSVEEEVKGVSLSVEEKVESVDLSVKEEAGS